MALSCLVAVVTAVVLGLPNHPKTFSLAGYESRLVVPNTIAYGFILLSGMSSVENGFRLTSLEAMSHLFFLANFYFCLCSFC
jgi:hypothetical protein